MDILEMSAQISALCKSFLAFWTGERPQASVLPEVITQVAALLECAGASWVFTLKEKLDALGVWIFNFDCLVPLVWNSFKMLHFEVALRLNPVFMVHIFIFMRVIRLIIVHTLLNLVFLHFCFRISRISRLLH